MKVQILGTGCPKCRQLAERAEQAAREGNHTVEIVKVTDINEILAFGVMSTPGLAVDGEVLVSGRVPSVADIGQLLSERAGGAR
jgi:small redox-active disulfide protein 2